MNIEVPKDFEVIWKDILYWMFNNKPIIYEGEQSNFLIEAPLGLEVKSFTLKWSELKNYLEKLKNLDYVKLINLDGDRTYALTKEGFEIGLELTKFVNDRESKKLQNKTNIALTFISAINLVILLYYSYLNLSGSHKYVSIVLSISIFLYAFFFIIYLSMK